MNSNQPTKKSGILWWRQFGRIVRAGMSNLERNVATSVASLLVLCLTLLSVSLFAVGLSLVELAIEGVEQRVDVSVYFDPYTPETQIMDAKAKIEQMPHVTSVSYLSKDEALIQLKSKYSEDSAVAKSLEELATNPLPPTLTAKADDPKAYADIAAQIETDLKNYSITDVSYQNSKKAIDRLTNLARYLRVGGGAVAVVFVLIAIMISFSSIRLAIHHRRREIEIMHLVGATKSFIRGPFLIEGLVFGIASALITIFIIGALYFVFAPRLFILFSGFNAEKLIQFGNYWWVLLLGQLVIGSAIGLGASWLAIKRHLERSTAEVQ